MAQHDYVIANGTGAAVRSDLNNALAAIVSNNSGATEPTTTYAYMWWPDTSTGLLKLRNGANNAWITLRELDGTLTIEDGTASSPGLAFADDLNTGIYSPSADQLGITTGGTVRLTTTTTGITSALPVDVPLGTASAPTVTFTGDLNTGIYSPGADQVAISTNGTGRLFVDSSGRVLIGTSSARDRFDNSVGETTNVQIEGAGISSLGFKHLSLTANSTNAAVSPVQFFARSRGTTVGSYSVVADADSLGLLSFQGADGTDFVEAARIEARVDGTPSANDMPGRIVLSTTKDGQSTPTEAMRIDSQQRVGIGTTSPNGTLTVEASSGRLLTFRNPTTGTGASDGSYIALGGSDLQISNAESASTIFYTADTERARIDSSGRLLVGTSTSMSAGGQAQYAKFQIIGSTASATGQGIISIGRGQAASGAIGANNDIGYINFTDNAGNEFAQIGCLTDATTGSNDYPGRLVFSTTADGASSPTERMRIPQNGFTRFSNTGTYTDIATLSHGFRSDQSDWTTEFVSVSASPYGIHMQYTGAAPNNTGQEFIQCSDTGALRAAIRSNGGLANFSANNANLSDRNAKKDISPAADTWDCIKEWEIVNYRYKDQPDDADPNLGVIAQQVAESCPEVITVFQEAKEATEDQPAQEERLGVKEQQMYWMAIKALQEAQVRIEALEAEVAALKAQ